MEERYSIAELKAENEKLKKSIKCIKEALEKRNIDTCGLEKHIDESDSSIEPPWIRQGYEDKQSWINDKKSN